MEALKTFLEIGPGDIDLVGGKAFSLGNLSRAGFTVPYGFVVTTAAYKEAIINHKVGKELKEAVFNLFKKLKLKNVAVRSSAIAEDSPESSWAGQFDSFLNVTEQTLIESIEMCWESVSSEIVKNYAEGKSISDEKLVIAVVIQKMVESDVSGVAFSVNPITKNPNEIMIEAIYGLGELLVQGMITPDNYVVSKNNFEVLDKKIAHKDKMMVYREGKNSEEPVPLDKADLGCLVDRHIIELSGVILNIEKHFGTPQDVEWALEKDKFYILQSRPITTL